MVIFNPFQNIINFYKEKLLATTQYTVDILLRFCVVVLILANFLLLSIFLYLTIYNAHVPSVMHVYPVHLYYDGCSAGPNSKEVSCSYPKGHVQLTKERQLLMVGQDYKVSLILELPESPANKDAGMFMVCGQLTSRRSVTVGHSCRSASLRYRSPLVTMMTSLVFAPLYVIGSIEEKQTNTVVLFDSFSDDQTDPVTDMYIDVKSHHAQIYSAQLQISAQMSGLRYLMFYWRTTSAVFGVTFIFGFVTFIASLSLWQLYGPHNESGREYMYENFDKLAKQFSFLKRPKVKSKSSSEDESKFDENYYQLGVVVIFSMLMALAIAYLVTFSVQLLRTYLYMIS